MLPSGHAVYVLDLPPTGCPMPSCLARGLPIILLNTPFWLQKGFLVLGGFLTMKILISKYSF